MELITSSSTVKRLHEHDNVAVAMNVMSQGMPVGIADVTTRQPIPAGHKLALKTIEPGEHILKYGQVIGYATQTIEAGAHVHTQNVAMQERASSLDQFVPAQITPVTDHTRTFQGFVRPNGKVGTRNYIGILSTVNCSATVSKAVADKLDSSETLKALGYDGVVAITHGSGCAINTEHEGFTFLDRVMRGYADHPNFAFILVIGLGCETYQVKDMIARQHAESDPSVFYFNIQEAGGTRASIKLAEEKLLAMARERQPVSRSSVPLSELCVALQCGGSDGYSGITANPALGYAADLIVRHGGSVILAETPEIYGAEHLLLDRAISQPVAQKLLDRIDWWKHYTAINNAELNNNPSPGNKAGGLTTILEKSLGAVAKGGTSSLNDVLEYAEPRTVAGFNFMDSPGYDPVSVTGQIASGANVVCFTTGRGSVSGFKPAPCIKLATNSAMYQRIAEDMDINCGTIIEGDRAIEAVGEAVFERIIAIASGEASASESLGYGNNEFVPWSVGAIT
ncbi:galactonate dehydratase [Terasakiispira papahanaumokuakeensis]|uniref:Galactonate dehydratase n=1 Tax=Terasakiispira papahanaumokuakeensis TaxID=197479 RepID=A0A1E2VAH7_9GAMM|nr:altronate dehydratase family protein [Terasakiispira papahanaumokuakeensis]ODC04018.1 galactonate dehydratase [Terasakiispira papahanaumokuakeensis]